MKSFHKMAIVAFSLTGIAMPAYAETFIYSGNEFTWTNPNVNGGEPVSTLSLLLGSKVSASFTFDDSLTNNYTGTIRTDGVKSFNVSTGLITLSSSDLLSEKKIVVDFIKGSIVGWSISLGNFTDYGKPFYSIQMYNPTIANVADTIYGLTLYSNGPSNYIGQIASTTPGTWTQVSSVPGPIAGAGLPALLGILGFGFLRRRSSEKIA